MLHLDDKVHAAAQVTQFSHGPEAQKTGAMDFSTVPVWFASLSCRAVFLDPAGQRLPDRTVKGLRKATHRLSPGAIYDRLRLLDRLAFSQWRELDIRARVIFKLIAGEDRRPRAEAAGLYHKQCLSLVIHDLMEDSGHESQVFLADHNGQRTKEGETWR